MYLRRIVSYTNIKRNTIQLKYILAFYCHIIQYSAQYTTKLILRKNIFTIQKQLLFNININIIEQYIHFNVLYSYEYKLMNKIKTY